LDAYYNNAGQKVFSDNRTNGVFSEAGDTAMLSSNVRSVTSGNAASNFSNWLNSVRNGGAWDYKTPAANGGRGYYFFNGKLVNANDFGNMNYGYTGAAIGMGSNVLVDAAGVVEGYDAGRTSEPDLWLEEAGSRQRGDPFCARRERFGGWRGGARARDDEALYQDWPVDG
jgi:hypothetical protein